jgi:hypothetical protein
MFLFPWELFLGLKHFEVEFFHFFTRPWRLSEKGEAGFEGGIILETVDFYLIAKFFPTIMIDKLVKDHLEGFPVEGVV